MRARTERRVTAWEARSTEDGYAGLHALSEASFSGAVASDGSWLFMIDGRPVGLAGGSIESFADASLDAHTAPHRALPLLFAMREREGEVRGRYYTGDTPLSEVAETLSAGGFTGYVELSENVLSGEYYLVYHRGRSMAVAFVGENERLLTDEEARERANDEVGIYEVRSVDVEAVELPEPPASEPVPTGADGSEPSAERGASDTGGETTPEDGRPSEVETDDPARAASAADTEPPSTEAAPDPAESAGSSVDREGAAETDASADEAGEPAEPASDPDRPADEGIEAAGSDGPFEPTDRWGSVVEQPVEDRLAAERQWRETVRIPSVEPEGDDSAADSNDTGARSAPRPPESDARPDQAERAEAETGTGTEAGVERPELERVESDVDRLREEVASMRDRIEALEAADPPTSRDDHGRAETLPPARALEATNLFVRYADAGEPTLEAAHSAGTDREPVVGNLRLERHTGFEPGEVAVDGRPFEEFLEGRLEYRFADWLVGDLLFDLRETGHEGGLAGLYDALPRIDRIDFDGAIDAGEVGEAAPTGGSEDGAGDAVTFDVVFRDRLGDPLIVADCVDSREAVDDRRVASLVRAASGAKRGANELAGAMLATTSFFDRGALETAQEATSSGLLGGGSRESYVTVSRRCGYHLCLIEMRDAFHVRVPEL